MTGSRKSHDGGVPKPSRHVELYCDGACRGNPGPGGYGVILRCDGHEKTLSGAERRTTNNRMELSAAIAGLVTLTERCSVEVFTDSQYLKNGMTEWVRGWIAKGWKTAAKKPVLNQDLWKELLVLCEKHQVRWQWVRGHSGHELNERCDRLANEAIDRFLAGGMSRDASG